MDSYQSSEEIRRHVGAFSTGDEKKRRDVSEVERLRKLLDTHIAKHSSTVTVRTLAKENKRTADYQLDLSADIVETLTKIKSELR